MPPRAALIGGLNTTAIGIVGVDDQQNNNLKLSVQQMAHQFWR
jgi:hypothetical protein